VATETTIGGPHALPRWIAAFAAFVYPGPRPPG
jgi:hypothetical protein